MVKSLHYLFILVCFQLSAIAAPFNKDKSGVSIDGFDTVAYFTEDKAVRGSAEFQVSWNGATWWFANIEHLNQFVENPEKYAPRFAGHCANGLSDGHLVEAKPKYFRIIEGRLYLFYSRWGRAQWASNVENQIQLAEENWAKFSGE